MRCQYCGKRLPLFRKLKDGEFCSAAHREQFLAQSDQLAVAALQEQRERTKRAGQTGGSVATLARPLLAAQTVASPLVPPLVPQFVPAQVTAQVRAQVTGSVRPDAAFCDRYLVASLAAFPLGQLARMPLEPMVVRQQLLMPERFVPAVAASARMAIEGPVRGLAADQVLLALNDYGAPVMASNSPPVSISHLASSVATSAATCVATLGLGQLPVRGLMALARAESESVCAEVTELLALPLPLWMDWQSTTPHALRLHLELDIDPPPAPEQQLEAVAMANAMPLPVPAAWPACGELLADSGQVLLTVPAGYARPVRPVEPLLSGLGLGELEECPVLPVSLGLVLHPMLAGAKVTFPALVPVFWTMPVRPRAALELAAWAGRTVYDALRPADVSPFMPNAGRLMPVLTPQLLRDAAYAALADRVQITGELHDLVQPATLAPARRIPWRFEAQNVFAIRTLAVRHCPVEVQKMWPARPTVAVGPRRADQQIRLSAALRPARFDFAAGADAVTFHLEPKVMQPRLRVRPDPARQGGARVAKGLNHADAAVSSIKIPVLRRFWAHAPADIRWVALIIPLVLFLAWYSWTPNGKALNKQAENADLAVDTSGVQTVLASFKSRISSRAAVELSEDFRAGLAAWQGARQDWAGNWSYDQAGFIRPGNLALFTPTVGLRDYHFEFLGQIENHALSWVYRAKDARNYYLGRLTITRGGPVPEVSLVRSVVTDGRESRRKQVVLTMNLRTDTIYRVRVDVNGSDFTTSVLGQVVDTFTDASHSQGGVGFYGGHGETSRIRWVEVSHQYDTLGRLCAMLVPYGLAGATVPVKTDGSAAF